MVAQNRPSPLASVVSAPSTQPRGPIRTDRFKRACDLGIGLGLSLVVLPVILTLWALVRATSSGPGFYSQLRVGRGGRAYRIYKIRTMTHNCEVGSGAKWATKGDSRVTPLGRVLRKLHLDELPQLWNVLRGDMSLVGPRPERPEFVVPLSAEVDGYLERLRVRPGVTGLAQIQLPADSDLDSVRTKLVLDRYYVENASFWLDIRLMLGTAVYLLGFSYAKVRRLMKFPNPLAEVRKKDDKRSRVVLGAAKVVLSNESASTHVPAETPILATEGNPASCSEAR
jgi:lipopolysaccharide/colanic/teichoic acid biosynthesis glycosyltransferase